MDAYVSGQAGRAVCLDGERAFLIDVNALDARLAYRSALPAVR